MTTVRYFHCRWLVDGSGQDIQENMLLKVEHGIVIDVCPYETGMVSPGETFDQFVDRTVLPPYIDSHLHLTMSGSTDPLIREKQLHMGCDGLEGYIQRHLAMLLRNGVLTIRDGGDRNNCVGDYLRNLDSNSMSVDVHCSGRGWHQQKRYGGLIGRSPANGESLAEGFLRDNEQVDQVKLVNSGLNSLKHYGKMTLPQFEQAEIRELVSQADLHGKKVMVHANGERPVREALEAGCHSIEHGFFMGKDNLKRLADKNAFWVPTAFTMKAYAELLEQQGELQQAQVARKNLDAQLEQLSLAKNIGVQIALGTDSGSSGVFHGQSLVEEMKLFIEAGYSLSETIASATSVGGQLLGINRRGLLKKGSVADFLVIPGSPWQILQQGSGPDCVYKDGRLRHQFHSDGQLVDATS